MLDSKESNINQLYKKLNTSFKEKNINCKLIIYKAINALLEDDKLTQSEFNAKIFKPIEICNLDIKGNFIKSEYNNEENSFRSPWTNQYFPDLEYPKYPPNELRLLEERMNELFKKYTELYYGHQAVSSVFVWEQGDTIQKGFNVALLIKNQANKQKALDTGEWESVNIITANFFIEREKNVEKIKVTYKLSTNISFKLSFGENINLTGEINKLVK
jgi:hypothetical protein